MTGVFLKSENWPLLEWPVAVAIAVTVLYALGGRLSASPSSPAKRRRGVAFYAGVASAVIAIGSPIDAYADRLFWAHMVQHVLLTMVAPPLVLLGRPWPRVLRPLARPLRRRIARTVLVGAALRPARRAWRFVAAPVPAFVLFNGALLLWHVPVLYDLTLRSPLVHDVEHALFFATALAFWANLLPSARPVLTDAQRVVYGTAALGVSWLLALVLGLAGAPLYDAYATLSSRPGGLSALADQQLAAGVMWVPASIPYCIVLAFAIFAWLDPETHGRQFAARPEGAL